MQRALVSLIKSILNKHEVILYKMQEQFISLNSTRLLYNNRAGWLTAPSKFNYTRVQAQNNFYGYKYIKIYNVHFSIDESSVGWYAAHFFQVKGYRA